MGHSWDTSPEEITHRVELEYRLFLSIDSSLYSPKTIFFRGCAKFRPLVFFLNPIWPPPQPNILKMTITPQVFVTQVYQHEEYTGRLIGVI